MTLSQTTLSALNRLSKLGLSSILSFGMVMGLSTEPLRAGEIVRSNNGRCVVMGRIILSWDAGIENGAWVCEQDVLRVGQNLRADLLCFNQGFVARLQGGEHQVASECQKVSLQTPRRCAPQSALSCTSLRGEPASLTTPWLHTPYGDTLATMPQQLKWQSVSQADRYQIYVEGEGKVWQYSVAQPWMDLSQQQLQFDPQGTYLITITAWSQNQLLGKSSRAFNLLSATRQQHLQHRLGKIQSSTPSITEQAHYITQLYWDEGLYDQALAQLETWRVKYPNHPEILMLLGDRYLEVGRFDLAQKNYQDILAIRSQPDLQVAAEQALERLDQIQQAS